MANIPEGDVFGDLGQETVMNNRSSAKVKRSSDFPSPSKKTEPRPVEVIEPDHPTNPTSGFNETLHNVSQSFNSSGSVFAQKVSWWWLVVGGISILLVPLLTISFFIIWPNSEGDEKVSTDTQVETSTNDSAISQEESLALVQKWFDNKPQIFGSDYQVELLNEILTGDQLFRSQQSLERLRDSNLYFLYNSIKTPKVVDFSSNGEEAVLIVSVDETYQVISSNSGEPPISGQTSENWVYFIKNTEQGLRIHRSGSATSM